MTQFEKEQRRAGRQMKAFEAAKIIRSRLGPAPDAEKLEHVRVAALSAVAESRATMHALLAKGIVSEREIEDCLDWGYDSVLQSISGSVVMEVSKHG